ncbi:hypothetical protein PMAYCL1PPCAC_22204, partial [Pristionchus mayeri]
KCSVNEDMREKVEALTKLFRNENPNDNVERPFPSAGDPVNFCWYDLTEVWDGDSCPCAVPASHVDRNFNYGISGFVNLPFAEGQANCTEGTSQGPRNQLIAETLSSFAGGVRDLDHLETGIRTFWKEFNATTLRKMFKGQPEEVCDAYLDTITKIALLALKSEHLVTKPLPSLTAKGRVKSVSMSQEQATCLLAYCFFCATRREGQTKNDRVGFTFHLFHTRDDSPLFVEKMKFILHYFKTVTDEMPTGTLTFSRQTWNGEHEEYGSWNDKLSDLVVTSEGLIEDMEGCLQVDFANKFIGGGVMRMGAVQEELRFLCCPEMLVSMLLCEKMWDEEAILIQGAQQYSRYEGYSNKSRHVPMELRRDEQRDRFGRARSYLVAINAYPFKQNREMQYEDKFIRRELAKAYAGFMRTNNEVPARPVATGNWGCGVYQGDKELKSLIQLIAASKAGRAMVYITFGEKEFAEQLASMVTMLKDQGVTNGRLFAYLCQYESMRKTGKTVF